MINDHPIIVIGSRWPGDRQRFSLAHELAHYIVANRLSSAIDEEQACNRFAGAFLFPKEAVLQVIGTQRHAIEWPELCLIKEEFQISMGAICHRIKDLGIIQDSYYNKLVNSFRRKGWNRTEPGPGIPPEKTHAFDQMLFHALGEGYIGEPKAAELLACSLDHLKGLLQVHNYDFIIRPRRIQ